MSDFADVEQFGREHGGCGGITPSAAPQPGGGFLLTLTCACGATFDRWVTLEEAKRPLPLPPRVIAPGPRPASPPRPPAPPSPDLEAAMREALEAEEASPAPPSRAAAPPPAAPAGDLDALMREALAAESKAPAPAAPPPGPTVPAGARTSPARLNLDTTIRTALSEQAAFGTARLPTAKRTRVVWLVLFAVLAFGVAGALYFSGTAEPPPATSTAAAPAPPPLPPDQQQRAALDEIMKSLRQLQAASSANTTMSVYSSRVIFAKSDVERFLAGTAPGPHRAGVREVLDIHLLAAAAWKARTLEQKDLWEAVGQDPAIELCPSVRRVVDFAGQPENVSRAQARGAAVASAIPLLWECAAEKIAALDREPAPLP